MGTEEILGAPAMVATGLPTTIHQKAAAMLTEAATKVPTGGQMILARTATAARDRQKLAAAKVVTAGMLLTEAIPLLEVITVVSVTTGTPGVDLSLIRSANDAKPPIDQTYKLLILIETKK